MILAMKTNNRIPAGILVSPYCTLLFAMLTFSRRILTMPDNVGSKISFFLVGLGVGALVGVLFAPRSGEETRDLIAQKADESKEFAARKARELRERADDLIERGKDVAARKKESISAAVDAGREAYLREASARPERA
jgi:gas vesicle protein